MLLGLLECQPHLKLYSVGFSGSEPFSQQGYRYPSTPPVYNLPCENVNLGAACAALAGIYLTFALWSATSRSAEKARKNCSRSPYHTHYYHVYTCELCCIPICVWHYFLECILEGHWRNWRWANAIDDTSISPSLKDYWTIPINSNMGFIVANE